MFADRSWLGHVKFTGDGLKVDDKRTKPQAHYTFDELLKMADDIFHSSVNVSIEIPFFFVNSVLW